MMKKEINFLLVLEYLGCLILSVSCFFVEGPIGVGLALTSVAFLGIKKLIEKFSNKDEFIDENALIFELIERKIQKQIINNFEYKIPKKKLLFIMMKILRILLKK